MMRVTHVQDVTEQERDRTDEMTRLTEPNMYEKVMDDALEFKDDRIEKLAAARVGMQQ